MTDRKCDTCIHCKEEGCEKWECEYEEKDSDLRVRDIDHIWYKNKQYISLTRVNQMLKERTEKRTVLTDSEREICKMFLEDLDHNCNEYKLLMRLINESGSEETPDKRTETHSCDYGNKETHGDVIYRADAIDALMTILDKPNHAEFLYTDEICKVLNELPAAEPEIIRCKDCEWWEKQKDSLQGRCALMQMYPTGEWFCGNAQERRTDE